MLRLKTRERTRTMDMEKPMNFLPAQLESNKKYALVKGVTLQSITVSEKEFVNNHQENVLLVHGLGELRVLPKESLDCIFVGEGISENSSAEFWAAACAVLVPGGALRVKFPRGIVSMEDASTRLLLGGFINSSVSTDLVAASEKPAWKPSAALPLKKKANANVWKFQETSEIVDEDLLLGENDCGGTALSSLEGVTVKKKACKNCTCGLADAESKSDIPVVTNDELEKSLAGCGSCSKGDAFRCGGCPYLGTPAFTPGTKPKINVKADGTKSLLLDVTSTEF